MNLQVRVVKQRVSQMWGVGRLRHARNEFGSRHHDHHDVWCQGVFGSMLVGRVRCALVGAWFARRTQFPRIPPRAHVLAPMGTRLLVERFTASQTIAGGRAVAAPMKAVGGGKGQWRKLLTGLATGNAELQT